MYDRASADIMEEARRYGLAHGISLPVHEQGKISSMLSLGRDKPFDSEAEREFVLNAGNVLAHSLHFASENLILPDLLQERRPHLSPRERECFQLVAQGKSNWDIGQLLAISEAAAAFHVKNVLKKLRVSTRMQAVAIGVALGMIT
jgi:DNA-binding CsgD family transcriptional regulator